jgi:ABC-type uncharacterized transport system permease subunit
MTSAYFVPVLAGYLASFALHFIGFESQDDNSSAWGKKILVASLAVHAAFLVALFMRSDGGVVAVRSEYAVSFLIPLVALVIESRYRARFLLLFTLPIAILISLVALLHTRAVQPSMAFSDRGWLGAHIGFMTAGFAALALAAAAALMYLLQSSQLKSKHLGKAFLKLPSLGALDRLHFRSLCLGVIFFSAGILTGVFWASDLKELPQLVKDPKVLLSFFTAFLYWVILAFRLSSLRRGQKIAACTVLVLVFLLVTLMSSHYLPAGVGKAF